MDNEKLKKVGDLIETGAEKVADSGLQVVKDSPHTARWVIGGGAVLIILVFIGLKALRRMISLNDYYMGRDKVHASALTDDIRHNAVKTTELANRLISAYETATGDTETRTVNSGWRPPAVNANTPGAAPRSKHMTAQAIDISDPEGDLDEWCMDNLKVLERLGLWMEHPAATKGWTHVQTVPPKSERRVFYP